jgi:hypothetical protein
MQYKLGQTTVSAYSILGHKLYLTQLRTTTQAPTDFESKSEPEPIQNLRIDTKYKICFFKQTYLS